MAPSPGERVFAIPELLEQILLRTSRDEPAELKVAAQLFGLLRVNRTFHDTITKSPVLREQMITPLGTAISDSLVVCEHARCFGWGSWFDHDYYPKRWLESWTKIRVNPNAGDCVRIKTVRLRSGDSGPGDWIKYETARETTWGDSMRWRMAVWIGEKETAMIWR